MTSKRKLQLPPTTNMVYVEIRDVDVLSARGGRSKRHPGNIAYLEEKNRLQPAYLALKAKKEDQLKTEISWKLVNFVKNRGGRFLKQKGKENVWFEMSDRDARSKASQALRDDNTPEGLARKRRRYAKKPIGSVALDQAMEPIQLDSPDAKREYVFKSSESGLFRKLVQSSCGVLSPALGLSSHLSDEWSSDSYRNDSALLNVGSTLPLPKVHPQESCSSVDFDLVSELLKSGESNVSVGGVDLSKNSKTAMRDVSSRNWQDVSEIDNDTLVNLTVNTPTEGHAFSGRLSAPSFARTPEPKTDWDGMYNAAIMQL